jgi:predicted nucleic acid-binding protein
VITAVDTNVLLDVFTDDPLFRDRSLAAIRRCLAEGQLVACDVVWAEVVAAFAAERSAIRAMGGIPVTYSMPSDAAASRAGSAWRAYRRRGGIRERLVADFLVGAHAIEQADRLLTRDRGFHKAAFTGLTIIDPSR